MSIEPLRPTHRLSRRHVLRSAAALSLGAGLASRAAAQERVEMRPAYEPRGPRPWSDVARARFAPGMPNRDYTPVFTPNGVSLPFKIVGGVKVYHLVAEEIVHEVAPGLVVNCWGYNGRTPGPTIEAVQGDRVRIFVTNRLKAPTSIHWHAIILPNGMDGVAGMTQPSIPPGETYVYEYIFPDAGSFMYHSHFDDMTQEGMGLVGSLVVHPRDGRRRVDRDFVLLLHEWFIEAGTSRPDPFEMNDFNVLTINGKVSPATHPLVARLGHRVRIRIGNLSAMDHHPIHLHGHAFKITDTDGGHIPESAQWPETTVLVAVGQTRTLEFVADNPGDWIMHCHMTHHTMNQMGHDFPNMIGVDSSEVDRKIQQLIPGYMPMGKTGMGDMADMKMPVPENSIPMLGIKGQFEDTIMGGMLTVLKVREHTVSYEDPGWYDFPPGTVSWKASAEELERNGITLPPDLPSPHQDHQH
jgi:manganese oxidase